MARVKISEYRAKKILFGDSYTGVQLRSGGIRIPAGKWVAKVDQGVKKRMKQGLVIINKPAPDIKKAIQGWEKKGFSRFLLEPLLPHEASEEQYFSLERVRDGVRLLYTKEGGIDIEEHPEAVKSYIIAGTKDIPPVAEHTGLPIDFLQRVYRVFEDHFLAFLEINPLVVKDGVVHALDAAVLVDSAGAFFVRNSWSDDDIVEKKAKHAVEGAVADLAATTPASLKLSVINPQGSLFFLLSGGGGSIVIADEAQLRGAGSHIGNYGEYSGGPTREETYLYTKEVIKLMLGSKRERKALVIAGGVANFTDVKQTFLGIIDALSEYGSALRKGGVKVFVRRGGPNEEVGLALMRDFLEKEQLLGSIAGSNELVTKAVDEAIDYVL